MRDTSAREATPAPAADRGVEVVFVRNLRARRYVMRMDPEGRLRVTLPRGGTLAFADQWLRKHGDWILRQRQRWEHGRAQSIAWQAGTPVWFRGRQEPLVLNGDTLSLTDVSFPAPPPGALWRPHVENALRQLASQELPPLVRLAALRFGLDVGRIQIRNQRSRWGSCSRKKTISLNWRLVQLPISVRDYLIAHELAHLREMNHSGRFWRVVNEFDPSWRAAELWLRRHGRSVLA